MMGDMDAGNLGDIEGLPNTQVEIYAVPSLNITESLKLSMTVGTMLEFVFITPLLR